METIAFSRAQRSQDIPDRRRFAVRKRKLGIVFKYSVTNDWAWASSVSQEVRYLKEGSCIGLGS